MEIQLKGDDLQQLNELSARLAELVRSIPGTREVTTSLEEGQAEVQLVVNRRKRPFMGLALRRLPPPSGRLSKGRLLPATGPATKRSMCGCA